MTHPDIKHVYKASRWGSEFHSRRENEVFGAGAAGPGKALSLTTLVPTPDGFRYFKDIKPGSTVFNIRGEKVKVIAETEVYTDRPCYELTIADEKIIADAEHLWCIEGGLLKTSKQIHESSVFRTFIPAAESVDYDNRPFLLDPYVLGVCLIRGQPKDRSCFTTWDAELYSNLRDIGYTLDDVGYKVAQIRERKDKINELVSADNRRIPLEYLHSSFNQRMALVEGIMDGGYGQGPICKDKDRPFLNDFYTLCASLGLGPVINKTRYRQERYITVTSREYRCSRLIGSKVGAKKSYKLRHAVKKIIRVPSVPTKCIQVSGGGTFLVTKSFLPTHNSMVLLTDPLEQVWIEHIRCQQEKVPDTVPGDIKALIEQSPLKWGHSEGWILHLRRTMPRLEETIQRSHRMFKQIDPAADWNDKKSTWTFSSGIKYTFGHCKDRNDYNNYLGRQYSYLGWDELVEFNKEQYDFISSRLRTGDRVLQHFLKNRSMSNPRLGGNKGEDISIDDPAWVKRYFVDPWPDGNKTLVKKIVRKDGTIEHITRRYMPATLYDNPDPIFVKQYEAQLLSRPKHIRDVYLYGKWDTIMGSFLEEIWNPSIHICKPFKIPTNWPIFRSCDWGFRSNGIIGWYAISPEGTIYKFFEVVFKEKTADYAALNIVKPFEQKNKLWHPEKGSLIIGPADTQLWEERGDSPKTKYQLFSENGVNWVYADKKSREDNAEAVVSRLQDHANFTKVPGLVFFENCKASIQSIPSLETDPNNIEVPKKGGFDHPWDETSYACKYAKNELSDAPQYKGEFTDSLDEAEEMVEDRGAFGYWAG
jgi:hypothetical protein